MVLSLAGVFYRLQTAFFCVTNIMPAFVVKLKDSQPVENLFTSFFVMLIAIQMLE